MELKMNEDQKFALTLMHAALTDFLVYYNDPNMPMQSLLERAAQAALAAESAFPGLKE
jgi:hypothetical protein